MLLLHLSHAVDAAGLTLLIAPHGMIDPWALRHSRWKKRIVWRLWERRALAAARCLHALGPAEAEAIRALPAGTHCRRLRAAQLLRRPADGGPGGDELEPALPAEPDPAALAVSLRWLFTLGPDVVLIPRSELLTSESGTSRLWFQALGSVMGSTITARGKTVIPAPIRERFSLGRSHRTHPAARVDRSQ